MGIRIKVGSTGTIIFGLVFCAVGLVVAGLGWRELSEADASASWPSVKGEVTSSEVRKSTSSRTGRRRQRSTKYRAVVKYEYSVDGTIHTGNRISFDASSSSRSTAGRMTARYPKGAEVDVFYDPESPGEAVLERGKTLGTYIPLGVGLLFFAVGCVLTVKTLIDRKNRLAIGASRDNAVAKPE